jgi:hypothetical protein
MVVHKLPGGCLPRARGSSVCLPRAWGFTGARQAGMGSRWVSPPVRGGSPSKASPARWLCVCPVRGGFTECTAPSSIRTHCCANPASAWGLLDFFEVADLEEAPGGLVQQEGHFVVTTDRSRRARFAFVADQSDHSPDPKPHLTSDAAYAEPLGPQGQRCFHFLGLALLHSTPPKLFPFGSRTSQPRHHTFSDHCPLELRKDAEHLKHGSTRRSGRIEPLLMQE